MIAVVMQERTTARVDIGTVLEESLGTAGMSHKEACLLMEMDASQFSRGIRGGALDLWKLSRLPWRFWAVFIPKFVQAHTAVWLAEWKGER